MRAARGTALSAVAAAVISIVSVVTPASADPGDTLNGGCGSTGLTDVTVTNGQTAVVIYEASTSQEASGGPSTATVSCWIEINGVEGPSGRLTVTGNGAQSGQTATSYYASSTDVVLLCQQVSFEDGSTWTAPDGNVGKDCIAGSRAPVPTLAAYGSILISDTGTGPQAAWSYGGVFSCQFSTSGPPGAVTDAKVTCTLQSSPPSWYCPAMVVFRTTASVVGARASCDQTLDLGVGGTGWAIAALGDVVSTITCEAYVTSGALTPPYSVWCDEPGWPTKSLPRASLQI